MVRIALPDSMSRDLLDDVGASLGLLLVNIVPKTGAHPAQRIYVTPDRRAQVHLVEEGAAGGLSYVVQGAPPDEERWSAALRARLAEPS